MNQLRELIDIELPYLSDAQRTEIERTLVSSYGIHLEFVLLKMVFKSVRMSFEATEAHRKSISGVVRMRVLINHMRLTATGIMSVETARECMYAIADALEAELNDMVVTPAADPVAEEQAKLDKYLELKGISR